jgi:hypothetical protein
MKVQCQCGAKYAIDVTPDMARNPVRFICPACNLDLSGPINDLVREELGVTAAAPMAALLPATEVATATATAAPPAPMRIAYKPAAAAVSFSDAPAAPISIPAAPARLSISKGATTATHGTAVETAPQPGGNADEGKPCPKHQGEFSVATCYICRKPICPKCMELFGYVCSPLCRGKAEANGINVPVFAGQRSVVEAEQWRKMRRIGMGIGAGLALLVGVWIWWDWHASVPHPIFSVVFPERSYAGSSQIVGKNQIVFLHGGVLARYKLGSKTAVWTNEIITKEKLNAEVDRQMNGYKVDLDAAIKRGVDSEFRPRSPRREELETAVQEEMETSLQLFVHDQNIWLKQGATLTRYDWETGKAGQEIRLPGGSSEANVDSGELQFIDDNAFGQHIITHLSLASGEMRTEEIGEPRSSAALASTRTATPATTKKGQPKAAPSAGLPTQPGVNSDQPMDPAQVAKDAQKLPYAAKIALPATLSNTKHQNDILNEIKSDEQQDTPAAAGLRGQSMDYFGRGGSFIKSKYGYLDWSSKLLEQKGRVVKVLKEKPARSALESNPSVTNTAAVANEILNDMQRENGGDSVTEDVSRYQVTVHRDDAKDVADWVGEVIGPPSVHEQKTVTVVAGGEMIVVLDKTNKKLWQSDLGYKLGTGSRLNDNDSRQTSVGEGPVVEHGDTLYVFDQAKLTAYELATGNVRWRVPTIGIVGVFFDDLGSMYVNSTTADLDSLRFARQIDINKKVSSAVLRIDCKTGKKYWEVQPGGLVSHVEGKFVFCFVSHQAPDDLDPDSLTTMPSMNNYSAMDIRRLDAKNGKMVWDYVEKRCPLSVRFNGNIIELVFRKEVEVLKFLTF